MTVRERTKALTTGPGEKLRKALELGPEHSGTCAQLARATSLWGSLCHSAPRRKRLLVQIEWLVKSIDPNAMIGFTADCTGIYRAGKKTIFI